MNTAGFIEELLLAKPYEIIIPISGCGPNRERRYIYIYIYIYKGKGKAVSLQAWSGPEGSRKLR